MKNLVQLVAIAAVISLTALPATASGRHHGQGHKAQGHKAQGHKAQGHKAQGHRKAKRQHQRRQYGHQRHDYSRRGGHRRHASRRHWIGDGHGHKRHGSRFIFNFGYVAPAPTYYVAPLPAYVIVDRLHRNSYYNIGSVYLDRGHYYVRAHNPYGARVKLVIHAGSGSIVARYYLR